MSGSSYYCFTHTNISTCTQLVEKLKDLSEGASASSTSSSKGTFSSVSGCPIAECVVSDSHLAFLLEDGRVCRVRYNEEQPAGASTKEKSEVDDEVASTSSARSLGSRSASPRPEGEDRSSNVVHAWGSLLGSSSQPGGGGSGLSVGVVRLERLAGRGRIQLLRRRGSSRGIMGRWPLMPTTEVPDELVEQAMAVLQGKSREAVIRELQRTSLDVNQAVNNLLSRDDDEGEGSHDEGIAGFLPSGEELLSLLGSGLENVSGEELEDALGRGREEGGGRESRVSLYDFGEPIPLSEIRSLVSLGDGAAGGRGVAGGEGARRRKRKRKESSTSPMLFENEMEWWIGEKDYRRFKYIVGLHSELLAVDMDGRVCGWAWQSPRPLPGPHPLESELGLTNEKVRMIAGKHLRASVVTESGKIATWYDTAVSSVASSLQQRTQFFPELVGETVAQLHACELFSLVLTESKKLFWWGILPFAERKQVIMETQDRIRVAKYGSSGLSQLSGITPGSRVCLRSSPIYTVGAKAMHIKKGDVQCGILQENVFSSSLSEKCRFQVINPASPTEEGMELGGREAAEVEVVPLGSKRKHSDDPAVPSSASQEEFWSLRDVVFTEGCHGSRVGVVVKVDGSLVAVHFPAPGKEGGVPGEEGTEALADCRLLRRDDLILASEARSQNTTHFCQESPKRLRLPPCHQLLALACDSRGVHALFSAHFLVRLTQYEMTSGLLSQKSQLGEVVSRYLLRQGLPLQLAPLGISLWLVVDGNGGLYPLSRDSAGAIKDPPLLNLPPVTSVGVGVCSGRSNLVVLGFRHQQLMSAVLRCDLLSLRGQLEVMKGNPVALSALLSEHCSGGCNVLHVLVVLGRPPDPPASQGEKRGGVPRPASRSGVLREIMRQAVALASGSTPTSSIDTPLWQDEDSEDGFELPVAGDVISCLDYLLALSEAREPLRALLQERNMEGYTPFMAATACKSYAVALRLLDMAESLASGSEETLLAMLHPADSHPDDNPVFVLCRNNTCSFTWTGEEHIQQDIFECQTCGLVDSLCCCTECAYTCHRGHNCSFKRSSPTAYCDCWERCRCKALSPGSDSQRQSLLLRLLKHTSLGTRTNTRKEHLLGMLVGMVTRQSKEQSHWHALRSSTSYRPRSKNDEMPAHDLAPPKFAQKALSIVLEDWACVKAALLSGMGEGGGGEASPATHSTTVALDALVYTLLAKLSQETLDSLLTTLVKHMGPSRSNPEARSVSERFLRSVVRVFTSCQIEVLSIPTPSLSTTSTRRKSSGSSVLQERAERVFLSLAPLAVRQLVPMARAIILPVCRGMARPVDPTCMSDRHKMAEELFRLPIPSLLRVPSTDDSEQASHGEGGASDTESEAGDGEESTSGGPAHDASSTATVGSNPIYLSDQDSSEADDLDSGGEEASMDGDNRHDDDIIMEHAPSHRLPPSSSHWALPFSRTTHSSSSRLSRTSGHSHFRSLSSHSHRGCLSMGVSSALLAKTFSLLVRQLAEVLEGARALVGMPTPPSTLPIMESDPQELGEFVWAELQEVWSWLVGCMDAVECQVRLGNDTERRVTTADVSSRPASMASTEILESRRDFLSYLLTLMRRWHREHGGTLPAIDVAALEHLAWCLDGVMYLLQHTEPLPSSQPMDSKEGHMPLTSKQGHTPLTSKEGHTPLTDTKTRTFFRRSSSVTCLGSVPNSPFDPLAEALPLAEKPHLLEPDQCREALFGFEFSPCLESWPSSPLPPPPLLPLIQHPPSYGEDLGPALPKTANCFLTEDEVCGLNSHHLAASVLLGRWNCTIELFGRVFADTVGRSRGSYLADEKQFEMRERDFRREMDAIRSSSHREVVIEVERARDRMLPGFFNQLNSFCDAWQLGGTSNPPLCVYRVKVSFQGEQGEGSGLLRSLFTAVAEGLLSDDPLPRLELPPPKRPMSPLGKGRMIIRERQKARSSGQGTEKPAINRPPELLPDMAKVRLPLFYQPGKPGFYSPRLGTNAPERLNAYRNIGRVIGLCLLHCEILPLPLCRHVLKYLLHREVSWHDLAFFDPVMYESLRKLILESRGPDGSEHLANLGLSFHVTLRPEEGGEGWDLLPGGALFSITPDNVYQYVQKYAELRMVRVNEEALQHMRDGVNDVLPESVLSGLSPEDLRLLLCGCPHIDIDVLKGITIFNDEYRKGQESVTRFKGWFWSIVERMSQKERQELLYFWTSSPSLPANVDSYQPPPSVMIRPPDDQRLPTANTCISRLYIPLYSSKSLVKLRLLTAVKTKTFGFL